ncbi:putative ribonuclease H-like domain-containing protein, partial [Tanacetum coccineum]
MSEPMPTIPTQSPFTYPIPNPSASPSFTQDDTSESFIPEPTQPMPKTIFIKMLFHNCVSQTNLSIFSQTLLFTFTDSPTQTTRTWSQYPNKAYIKNLMPDFHSFLMMQGYLDGKEEGLHKGYDRFQKILSQLNQCRQADNDVINLKFLRALLLRGHLELDVRIGHSYGVKAAAVHSFAFIGAASSGSSVLILISQKNESDQDMIFEDFDQVDQLEMEELDLKWQMAMLSLRINRYEKISPKAFRNAVKTLESQKDWSINSFSLEEKSRAQIRKKEWDVKYEATLARFEKWKESSKNLNKLINSSMSTRTKIGLGFKEYFGEDEVFDLSRPSTMYPEPVGEEVKPLYSRFVKAGEMHAVPPSITGTYMPTPYKSDIEETQVMTKLTDSETYASCDSSLKTKTNDFPPAVDIKTLPESDVEDPNSTAGSPTTFPAGSRNSSASVTAGGSDPAASRNRPAVNSAGRPNPTGRVGQAAHRAAAQSNPAGWSKRPAPVSAGRPVSAGWLNPAARPYFRPSSVYFNNMYWPELYDPMYMNEGRWGTAGDPSTNNDIGIVDSGCSRSMTGNKEKLDDFVQVKGGIVKFGGGDGRISGKGTIRTSKLDFENVYYVEELQHFNLNVSLHLQHIRNYNQIHNVTCLASKRHPWMNPPDWHRRMAHVNFKTSYKLAKEVWSDGLPLKHISAVRLITETLQLLHMDLFGPTNVRSIDQKYYSLVVTDDFSRFTWTFFLGTKDETFYVLKEFIALIENQLNKKVKGIRCDNGTEFKNAKLIELCGEKGIKRDYSNPRTPQQNGVAERKNRTLIEAARTMLADSKLPTMFWTEAVSTACYVLNRVSITNPHNKTPYQLLSGKVPQIGHLKPFGCQVTILNTSDHLGKFEGKADEGYLVGYAPNSKAYRVYNLTNKRVEETMNLRFLEDKPNVQGIGHEWYFDLDYLTDSLGYTRFKTDTPAGTQETNIPAGTQAPDSDSDVEEQVIMVPSFPSNSFTGPSSSNGPSVLERNADYAEELAKLQRQEYEAKDAAARYGYLFSQATAEILSQAEAKIRHQGVSAARDPAGGVSADRDPAGGVSADRDPAGSVSAGSTSAGSDPAGGHPAGPFQTAGSSEPAEQGNPAVSTSVSADLNLVHANESTLPPGQSLGSSENTKRFLVPSDVCKDQ